MARGWWDVCWRCLLWPAAVLHRRRCECASLCTIGLTQHPAGHSRHLPHACADHIACNRCAGMTHKMRSGQLRAGLMSGRVGAGQQLGAASAGASGGTAARLGQIQTRRHQVGAGHCSMQPLAEYCCHCRGDIMPGSSCSCTGWHGMMVWCGMMVPAIRGPWHCQ